jgi:hypothetical protein
MAAGWGLKGAIINLESPEGRNVGRYSTVCFTRTIGILNCQLYKNNGSVIVFYRKTNLGILLFPNLDNLPDSAWLSLSVVKPQLLHRIVTFQEY